MLINAYVIFDKKAAVYNKPFYLLNDEIALRSASDLLQDNNTDIARHPEDFILFKIGTYDDTTAILKQTSSPETICNFHELSAQLSVTNQQD